MDFHTIESEKAKAMARYNRLRNIARIWRCFEALVAVFVLSWSSTALPSVANFVEKSLVYLCKYAYNPLVSFVVFNFIIVVLVLLSRKNNAGEVTGEEESLKMIVFEESDFELPSPLAGAAAENQSDFDIPAAAAEDLKMVFFTDKESKNVFLETLPPNLAAAKEREKQMVVAENLVAKDEKYENLVDKVECEAVCVAIEEAKKQIKRFERTQSVILRRDIMPRQRFRRSETERALSVIERVDTLSNEDFQRTVEEFIAKQQRFLLDQKKAEKQN